MLAAQILWIFHQQIQIQLICSSIFNWESNRILIRNWRHRFRGPSDISGHFQMFHQRNETWHNQVHQVHQVVAVSLEILFPFQQIQTASRFSAMLEGFSKLFYFLHVVFIFSFYRTTNEFATERHLITKHHFEHRLSSYKILSRFFRHSRGFPEALDTKNKN